MKKIAILTALTLAITSASLTIARETEPASRASVVRVFRKLIGRDPSVAEVRGLLGLSYDDAVDTVLASQQFQDEGFYSHLRDRLALNRTGSRSSIENSYNDYCALRLEIGENAAADAEASDGYWSTLNYKERWLPISSYYGAEHLKCFVGTNVKALLAAYRETPPTTPDEPTDDVALQIARSCILSLRSWFPGASQDSPNTLLKNMMRTLRELPATQQQASLLDAHPLGEELFWTIYNPTFGYSPNDPNVRRLGQVRLARREGRAIFLQELGSRGNRSCTFAGVDLPTFGHSNSETLSQVSFPPASNPIGTNYRGLLLRAENDPSKLVANVTGADGALYVRIEAQEALGVHASPFWLSTHRSTPQNQHLHRARLIYHSYFCADVNPDAANNNGQPPQIYPELEPYFAADDVHKNGSSNCYNCHALVQPLANFFGRFSYGADYDLFNDHAYLAIQGGYSRPGGLWEGDQFYPVSSGDRYDLSGLRDLLTAVPAVKSCVVSQTWQQLVGMTYPMSDQERRAAEQAFTSDALSAPSLRRLLRHYLLTSERGRAFGREGGRALDELTQPQPMCPDEPLPEAKESALLSLGRVCKRCHQPDRQDPTFISEDGVFTPPELEPNARGALWQDLYCNVESGRMPMRSSPTQFTDAERANASCVLRRERNTLARSGLIPAAYFERPCDQEAFRAQPHLIIDGVSESFGSHP